MILLVDWGNTYLKYIIIDEATDVESQLNLDNVKQVTSLELLESTISDYKNKLSSASISSVKKQSDNALLSKCLEKFDVEYVFAKTQISLGKISSAYKQYDNLGVDRWLTIIAGYQEKLTTGIVDIGSAITLDVVNGNGQHLGGHIVPGYKLLLESLKATDGVFVEEQQKGGDNGLLGKSTNECVNYGIEQMVAGYLESAIRAISKEHRVDRWIFTGGGGEYWCRNLSVPQRPNCFYDGVLVFKGLIKLLK